MKRGIVAIITVVLAALLGFSFWGLREGAKDSSYITAPVQRGDISQVVTATGSLSAVITVQVGSQVSGTIDRLYADFNTKVKKGDVIARINQDKFKAAVAQAKANLVAARANVEKARVSVEDTRRTLERSRELWKRSLISQSDLDAAQTSYGAATAQLEVNKAQVEQAVASLNRDQVDLDNTIIRSPVDGIVVSRNVDVGQTVAASLQAPTLFLIANDLSKMQVDSNVSEGDVGNVWVGQAVNFTVDAYPTRHFKGAVLQVRNAPIMVQNVVTYDAVVGVDNKELLLKPGMTANLEFVVSEKRDALKIPNAALRFRPPAEKGEVQTAPRRAAGAGSRTRGGPGNAAQRARGEEGRKGRVSAIYILRGRSPVSVKVRLGITDGSYTELVEGDLKEGDSVILAVSGAGDGSTPSTRAGGRRFFGF